MLWWPSGYTAVTILDHTTILTSGGIVFIPSSRQVDIQRGVVCARALKMLQLRSLPEAPVRSFKRAAGQNECSTTPPHTPQVACCAINGILGSKCTLTEVQGASTPPHMQHWVVGDVRGPGWHPSSFPGRSASCNTYYIAQAPSPDDMMGVGVGCGHFGRIL